MCRCYDDVVRFARSLIRRSCAGIRTLIGEFVMVASYSILVLGGNVFSGLN
jgi:hypothetical protein